MVDYSDNLVYADSRIRDSIVKINGRPRYVRSVSLEGMVYHTDVCGHSPDISSPYAMVDTSPFKLGYANLPRFGESMYMYRVPARQWRQGLRTTNTLYTNGTKPHPLDFKQLYYIDKGIYPTVMSCIETIDSQEVRSMAFHRHYCLTKDPAGHDRFVLMYRSKKVGFVTINDSGAINYNIHKNFEFLQEDLKEALANE